MRTGSSMLQKNLSTTRLLFRNPLFSDRYLRHNILIFGANILAGLFAYLLHPSLAHFMGIQEYGQVAALIALSLILVTPMQIISTVAAKYASSSSVSGNYAQLNGFIRRLTGILLVVGIGVAALFMAASSYVAFFFHLNSTQGVILLGAVFIVSFVDPLNEGVLRGLQRFEWYAALTLLSSLLRLILVVGFVLMGFGINGAIFGIVTSTLLTYLVSLRPLWKLLRGPQAALGSSLKSLWSYAILAAITAGGIVALYSIDTVLAGHFLSTHETGLYAALATIGRTVLFITSSVATVMFPRVIALHEQKKPHRHVLTQAILGVSILSAAAEIAFLLAPSFITQMLFGQAFSAIAELLPLYGLAMLLLSIAQVLLMYFLAIGNRITILIILLACLLQTGLIIWHHTSIAQLVQAVLITDAILVLALLTTWGMTCISNSLILLTAFSPKD